MVNAHGVNKYSHVSKSVVENHGKSNPTLTNLLG